MFQHDRSDRNDRTEPWLIRLQQASKRFAMHHEVHRSFQDSFIRLFHRQGNDSRTFWAIRNVTFDVERGDCFGVVGPNGSGKSTLLKLITGILEPTQGEVRVKGRIASLLELGAGFHPDLTGRENIYLNGSVYGISRRQMAERIDSIIDYAELGDFIDAPIKHYSSGMYVRLGFAVAIHTDPDVLLVDETLSVGDVAFQQKCLDSIQKFRARGGTLLFVSHDLGTIQSLCNKAIWLEHGEVLAQGAPIDVTMAYLNDVADKAEAKAGTEPEPEPDQGRRWGTGRIKITGVELCDSAGSPRSVFVTGAPLNIRLRYYAREQVHQPVFGIAIHHQSGVHVCGPNTKFADLHIPTMQGAGEVVYSVPELPLLEGTYLVSVAAVDNDDSETYDYHDRVYSLRVAAGRWRERYGVVTLSGSWSVKTALDELSPMATEPATL